MAEFWPKRKSEIPCWEYGKAVSAMKEAFSTQQSAVRQNQQQQQKQHQYQKPFTTEGTEKGKMNAEERVRQRAEAILKTIGEACDELEKLAEENPELVGRVTVGAEEHKEAYLRLKARLALADSTPRCRWVRQDGTTCGSPQMKRHIYCFAHMQMAEAQALALRLPALEDANAIMIGIMRVQKALIDGTISTKTAGLLLYSMQLALQAVGKTTFGQVKGQELVTETVDAEEALEEAALREAALSNQRSAFSETQGLPLINTDQQGDLTRTNANGRGLEREQKPVMSEAWPEPVEWRPTPDMYRMDTREGREAYEASFRIKIAQPRAAVPDEQGRPHEQGRPQEHAEPLPKGTQFASELLEASTRGSAF